MSSVNAYVPGQRIISFSTKPEKQEEKDTKEKEDNSIILAKRRTESCLLQYLNSDFRVASRDDNHCTLPLPKGKHAWF